MKNIVLIRPTVSQYDVIGHFTTGLYQALLKNGITCRLMDFNETHDFCYQLIKDPPDCTISFNAVLPDQDGRLFFDVTGIPHVSILLDSVANNFVYMTYSPNTILPCVDNASVELLHGIGFSKTFFMPHAIEAEVNYDPKKSRKYEAVMLGSCIDYEAIAATWTQYPESLQKVMYEAANISLSSSTIPVYQAIAEAIDNEIQQGTNLNIQDFDIMHLIDQIELYMRGKDRVELIKAIKTIPIHVFGSGNFEKYLGNQKNVILHPSLTFKEALEVMQASKIVLNSCPQFKKGSHERILYGLASGALVITNRNNYLEEQFREGESILFYQYPSLENLDNLLNEYLSDEEKRVKLVEAGRSIVMKSHTWDARAPYLIQHLTDILGI